VRLSCSAVISKRRQFRVNADLIVVGVIIRNAERACSIADQVISTSRCDFAAKVLRIGRITVDVSGDNRVF
jgi:hypothetical protein